MLKKGLQVVLFVVSIAVHIIGLLGLCYINHWVVSPFFGYLDGVRLLWKYVICAVTVAVGIILFTGFTMTLKGKLKNVLSIAVTAWSTVLTVPLLLTFVGSFFVANGIALPLVGDIVAEIQAIFSPVWLQYVIYVGGTILSIICLAVPIVTTVLTVKRK